MTSQRHPQQPDSDLKPTLMMDAFFVITVLAAAAGLPEAIIKGLGL